MPRPILTIDLEAIAANWRALDAISGRAETAAVVKANAYGLGIAQVGPTLERAGCRSFFVATEEEGVDLRSVLRDARIFVLNGCSAWMGQSLNLIPCLSSVDQLAHWDAERGGDHALQTNSGMNRLGVDTPEIAAISERLQAMNGELRLLLSHLACGDDAPNPANEMQRACFEGQAAMLRSYGLGAQFSLSATGGAQLGAGFHFDLVRCGIGLYGGMPFTAAKPVVSLVAPILQIREIAVGEAVGYGGDWRAAQPSRIAVLPLGYADGIHRVLGNAGRVYFGGHAAPMVGRVSMDLLSVDVTGIPSSALAAGAEIIGPNQSIDDLAKDAGTIGYEILTSLGPRYIRQYLGGD